jgi:hypothetical protein
LKTKVDVPTDLPPDVIVLPVEVDKKLAIVQFVTVIPVANVRDPYILTVLLATANVGAFVTPVQFIFTTEVGPTNVTVRPEVVNEFASKNTLSNMFGAQPEGAPPLVNDQ